MNEGQKERKEREKERKVKRERERRKGKEERKINRVSSVLSVMRLPAKFSWLNVMKRTALGYKQRLCLYNGLDHFQESIPLSTL